VAAPARPAVARHPARQILDLATGSGDVAFALARGLRPRPAITGMDFCQPMLEEAGRKKNAANDARYAEISFRHGDGLALPMPDDSVDAVTISFGLRNMADRHRALGEMRRVLRPGGRLYVLEFSQPQAWLRPLYYSYLRRVSPRLAGFLTGEASAYQYLCSSIAEFPDRAGLAAELQAAGFKPSQSVGHDPWHRGPARGREVTDGPGGSAVSRRIFRSRRCSGRLDS